MAQKYKFDYHSLQFKEESKIFKTIKTIFAHLIAIILTSLIFFILFSSFTISPKEKEIYLENKRLKQEYLQIYKKYNLARKKYEELIKLDRMLYKTIFQTKPPEIITPDYNKIIKKIGNRKFSKQNLKILDSLTHIAQKDNKAFQKLLTLISKENFKNIPSILPIPMEFLKNGLYGFGYKVDPFYKIIKQHYGIDFSASEETPVFATADGIISTLPIKYDKKAIGNYICINHQNGFYTVYSHLSVKNKNIGSKVKKGEIIGKVGNSGKSFIPHLHYEIIYKGKRLNPLYFFFGEIPYLLFEQIYYDNQLYAISLD